MLKSIPTFLIALIFTAQLSAQNLIPNPSFENVTETFCGIMNTSDFTTTIMDWNSPTDGTPDVYFTNVATSCYNFQPFSQYDGPIGLKGNQTPNSGTAMLGAGLFSIDGLNQREYVQTQLSEPMVIGHAYEINYYVSLADFTEFQIEEIGIHFSTNQLSGNGSAPLSVSPQIVSDIDLGNFDDWVLVTANFTADDNYEFMTIGNFNTDNNTNLFANPNASGEPGTYGAYYFFDDFSVLDLDATAILDFNESGFKMYPNPVEDVLRLENTNAAEAGTIRIYNQIGQLLVTQQITSKIQQEISVSIFPSGTYTIILENDTDLYTTRFIKM